MKTTLVLILSMLLMACANHPCKSTKSKDAIASDTESANYGSKTDRIFIAKSDGSKQCDEGSQISEEKIKASINFPYTSFERKNDKLIYPAACGRGTGWHYVLEISKSDLAQAQKLGFKIWTKN